VDLRHTGSRPSNVASVDETSIRRLWDYQDPAGSERRFRHALMQADPTSEWGLELRTQVARALGLQRRFAEAHAELDGVDAELSDEMPVARLRSLLERGRVVNSSGQPEAARPFFERAWDLGREIPRHDLAVDAAHMVAITAPAGERQTWNERALAYAESCGDPEAERWLGSLYNNMGWDAHDRGDYAEALFLHERCWGWHRERHTGWGERVAKWSVGKQLRFLGRGAEALEIQDELLTEYLADEPGGEGFVHEEIAELLLADGKPDAARPHFRRAHELLAGEDWIEPDRIERLARLGSAPDAT
jgi:tetratricopeptide (TPR) repeat protein